MSNKIFVQILVRTSPSSRRSTTILSVPVMTTLTSRSLPKKRKTVGVLVKLNKSKLSGV